MITLDNELSAYLVEPSGTPQGALIVIHEVWGLVPHTKDVADRFAAEGYLVLAPDLLSDAGLSPERAEEVQALLFDPSISQEKKAAAQPMLRELLAPIRSEEFAAKTLERVKVCFDYLAARAEKVAITGFCFGGTYAFSLAVHEPRLAAAVPFYGHADFKVAELKNITAPVLAFYGSTDEPLMVKLPQLEQDMAEAGVDFTAVVYPETGHAFFNDSNQWVYRPEAAEDSWAKTLEFLATKLQA